MVFSCPFPGLQRLTFDALTGGDKFKDFRENQMTKCDVEFRKLYAEFGNVSSAKHRLTVGGVIPKLGALGGVKYHWTSAMCFSWYMNV